MLCFTDKARQSNIDRIDQLIEKLGHTEDSVIGFVDYCALCDYLNIAKDMYIREMRGG